uniref:Uncharacterized protein n=1 Tax=Tetraselmis sp. GSL018 TaxID=582737 RepID=A0A061R672_9CHLO
MACRPRRGSRTTTSRPSIPPTPPLGSRGRTPSRPPPAAAPPFSRRRPVRRSGRSRRLTLPPPPPPPPPPTLRPPATGQALRYHAPLSPNPNPNPNPPLPRMPLNFPSGGRSHPPNPGRQSGRQQGGRTGAELFGGGAEEQQAPAPAPAAPVPPPGGPTQRSPRNRRKTPRRQGWAAALRQKIQE